MPDYNQYFNLGGPLMYDLNLTESYIPAQPDAEVLETTVGGCLRATILPSLFLTLFIIR